jgi:hypothetical protein
MSRSFPDFDITGKRMYLDQARPSPLTFMWCHYCCWGTVVLPRLGPSYQLCSSEESPSLSLQMEAVSERYAVFIKRLELSQDPAAREYLRSMNAQMLNGGITLPQMFEG